MGERALFDAARAHGLRCAAMRYFNASGADPDGEIGESHDPETHLIPLAIEAALGLRPALGVFGDDYPTPDGTCVRDFVHVCDLADAHVAAVRWLQDTQAPVGVAFNLCNERGFSVGEVVRAVGETLGTPVPIVRQARRPGDPPILVGRSDRARSLLGWRPRFPELALQIDPTRPVKLRALQVSAARNAARVRSTSASASSGYIGRLNTVRAAPSLLRNPEGPSVNLPRYAGCRCTGCG